MGFRLNICPEMDFIKKLKLFYFRRCLLIGSLNFRLIGFSQLFVLFFVPTDCLAIIIYFFGSLRLNLIWCFFSNFCFLTLKITFINQNQLCLYDWNYEVVFNEDPMLKFCCLMGFVELFCLFYQIFMNFQESLMINF